MKNIKRTIGMAKYLVLVAFISTTTFLTSCSDNTTNPVDETYQNSSVLAGGNTDDRKDDGGKTDDRKDDGKNTDNKKGLPVDCFTLSREQMTKYKELQSQRERANKPIIEEFNAKMNEIRMAEKRAMGDLLAKERELKKQLSELKRNTDNSDARNRFNKLQREAKAKIEEIRKAEKDARNAIMRQVKAGEITREEAKALLEELRATNKTAVDAIMAELRAAMQALKDSVDANESEEVKRIQAQLKEIRTQLDAIRKTTQTQLDALNAELKEALSGNENAFLDAFREMLTDEQKVRFDEWRTSGKNPCDPKRDK